MKDETIVAVVGVVAVCGLLFGFLAFMMWQKQQYPATTTAYRRVSPSELQDARYSLKLEG